MTPDCSGTPNATQVFDGTCKTINAGVAAYHGSSGYFLAYAVPSNSQTDIIYTFGDECARAHVSNLRELSFLPLFKPPRAAALTLMPHESSRAHPRSLPQNRHRVCRQAGRHCFSCPRKESGGVRTEWIHAWEVG